MLLMMYSTKNKFICCNFSILINFQIAVTIQKKITLPVCFWYKDLYVSYKFISLSQLKIFSFHPKIRANNLQ